MAKKGRRKLEEEEAASFEFPVFDEVAFVTKEFELAWALAVACVLAIVLGLVAWLLTYNHVGWYGPFGIAVLGIVVSPMVIGRLRPRSNLYTKADWAALIALEFFGWLALWFVLVNVMPAP